MQVQQLLEKNDENAKGFFIIDGEKYYVSFPIINHEHDERGYSFESSESWIANYAFRNSHKINCIVLHWDVCESARHCFRTLCQRGLSAHIIIDGDGSVYQLLDLIKLANHASGCNRNSIGIMLQNPVDIKNDQDQNRAIIESREPGNNRLYPHLDFTDEQKRMVIKVCDDLCKIFPDIPRIFPPLGEDGLVTTAALSENERVGIIGHYHAQRGRLGPGDSLWIEFYRAGYKIR